MSEMGKYCKAYYVERFRAFAHWKENLRNLRKGMKEEDGKQVATERTALGDNDILYLQENYVVTDGIFKDEHVIFDDVTEEWKRFCAEVLDFGIPELEREPPAPESGGGAKD